MILPVPCGVQVEGVAGVEQKLSQNFLVFVPNFDPGSFCFSLFVEFQDHCLNCCFIKCQDEKFGLPAPSKVSSILMFVSIKEKGKARQRSEGQTVNVCEKVSKVPPQKSTMLTLVLV